MLIVAAAMVLYQEFESRILVPRVYGRTLRLSPAIVLVAQTLLGRHAWALRLPVALASTACVALVLSVVAFTLLQAPTLPFVARRLGVVAEGEAQQLDVESSPLTRSSYHARQQTESGEQNVSIKTA